MAQEFRVETEVFADSNKQPVSESLTIFVGEVVYDFLLDGSKQTTMFDMRRGRIVILDPQRKIQTSLSTDNLIEFCTEIKNRAGEGHDSLFAPQFETQFDPGRRLVTLTSERITYRAKGIEPRHPGVVKQFQQFADWYARLNAVHPDNLPPFARIELNKALAERGLIPEEIERTIVRKQVVLDTKATARSVHTVHWLISNSDRSRIEAVGAQVTNFAQVTPTEFWVASVTARTK